MRLEFHTTKTYSNTTADATGEDKINPTTQQQRPAFFFFRDSWQGSAIFDDDMFGRAVGSADNGYQISDGRFGSISAIYDPHHNLPGNGLDMGSHHNPYGYLSAPYNYQVRVVWWFLVSLFCFSPPFQIAVVFCC